MNNLSNGLICKRDCHSLTVYSELNLAHQQLIEWLADKTMHLSNYLDFRCFLPSQDNENPEKKNYSEVKIEKRKVAHSQHFPFLMEEKYFARQKTQWISIKRPGCLFPSVSLCPYSSSPFVSLRLEGVVNAAIVKAKGGWGAHETPDNEHMPSPQWSSCVLCVYDKTFRKHLHVLDIHLF